MILLLGGTSDSAPIAETIAQQGYKVLVSTATDTPLSVGQHSNIQHRWGMLDQIQMGELITQLNIQALVDATHPYAAQVRATAYEVAQQLNLPYFSFVRPPSIQDQTQDLHFTANHEQAAHLAITFHRPILLTIGVRNLAPYVAAVENTEIPLIARVLPTESSHQACLALDIPEKYIILARGPFSVEDNGSLIQKFKIGVLVTKDGGSAGGVPEKLTAAKAENCEVIVVQRPLLPQQAVFSEVGELVTHLIAALRI